ncbi:unnamed protein product [Oikopleura dioica]|uniref:Uncharacterized protein n=1 Tax=Oikopleura dioica TaxID=34765 RepID=E4X6D9_OIKDI|nr:unnamed protein product [Oikopleura dioica]
MGTVIPVYSSTDYQFFKLHELPEKYLDECAELLSDEWSSKNPAGRRRILQSSSNDLPIHFVNGVLIVRLVKYLNLIE